MKAIITTSILLAGFIPGRLSAQCPAWESPDKSKKVKVIVWSEEGDCFKLKLDGADVNPDSANQVTFWVNVTASIPKMVVQVHGQEDKKALLMNDNMAALYYKVEKNKKGEYSLKSQPFKAEKTPEAQARDKAEFDANVQKQKDEQAKRDKEWDDKRAAEQAERDKAKAADKEKEDKEKAERDARYAEQRKQEDDARAKANPVKTETTTTTPTTTTTTPANSTPGKTDTSEPKETPVTSGNSSSGGYTKGARAVKETFIYNGKPIANTVITMKTPDGSVICNGKTASDGTVIMYTDYPAGKYAVDFFGEKENSSWSIKGAYTNTIEENQQKFGITDIGEGIKYISEQMGMDAKTLAKSMGFD